jgi:hypothetical protein
LFRITSPSAFDWGRLQVGRRLVAGSFFPAAAAAGTRSARQAARTRKPLRARMKTPFSKR